MRRAASVRRPSWSAAERNRCLGDADPLRRSRHRTPPPRRPEPNSGPTGRHSLGPGALDPQRLPGRRTRRSRRDRRRRGEQGRPRARSRRHRAPSGVGPAPPRPGTGHRLPRLLDIRGRRTHRRESRDPRDRLGWHGHGARAGRDGPARADADADAAASLALAHSAKDRTSTATPCRACWTRSPRTRARWPRARAVHARSCRTSGTSRPTSRASCADDASALDLVAALHPTAAVAGRRRMPRSR